MLKEAILRYMVIYQVIYIIFAQKTINPRAPMLTWATLCHTLNQRINKLYQYHIQYTKPRGKGGEGHPLNKLKIYTHSHASISLSQIRYLQWIYHKNKISWIQGQGQLKKEKVSCVDEVPIQLYSPRRTNHGEFNLLYVTRYFEFRKQSWPFIYHCKRTGPSCPNVNGFMQLTVKELSHVFIQTENSSDGRS